MVQLCCRIFFKCTSNKHVCNIPLSRYLTMPDHPHQKAFSLLGLTAIAVCPTFVYLCRSYPCPGSTAMIAFLHPSRFCARFGSSLCCFRSLRTRPTHLSLGLPRGLFQPTFIVVTCFATFVSSLLITWPYHERRFWVT